MDDVVKIYMPDEDIDCIMDMALSSACDYWLARWKLVGKKLGRYASEQISKGGSILFYPMEDEDDYECAFELTLKDFLFGVNKYIEDPFDYCMPYEKDGMITINAAEADDLVADCIIQYALFGELIYG